jgi:hypothetical protein
MDVLAVAWAVFVASACRFIDLAPLLRRSLCNDQVSQNSAGAQARVRYFRFRAIAGGLVTAAGFLCLPIIALAQQSGADSPTWTLEAENELMPRQSFGTFDNQQAAVAAIAGIPGPNEYTLDLYSYAKEVKSIEKNDKLMTITY